MVEKQNNFSQLEQVKWLGDHIEYYKVDNCFMSEDCKQVLVDMKTYANNLYTYPSEALRTYLRFKELFNNNPYEYMSSLRSEKDRNLIFSERLDAYFLPWEKEQLIPAAMLATYTTQENMGIKYKDFLNEKLNSYKKEQLEALAKEVKVTETGLSQVIDVWEKSKGSVGTNITGILCIIAMWILYCLVFIPVMQTEMINNKGYAVFMQIAVGTACVISSCVWVIGMCNLLKLRIAQDKKAKMGKVAKEFDRFYRVSCNPYNIDYMIGDASCVLAKSNVPWEDYFEIKEFAKKIGAKDKKKLLLVNKKMLYVYIAIIVIQSFGFWNNMWTNFRDNAERKQQMVVEISKEEIAENYEEDIVEVCEFDENGFIFFDSHERHLSRDEVMALKDSKENDFKTLLGFARNEIYARKGYPFKEGGKYYTYYMQYEWYQNIEHGEVTENMMNEYERANVDLIVNIEKDEGYR